MARAPDYDGLTSRSARTCAAARRIKPEVEDAARDNFAPSAVASGVPPSDECSRSSSRPDIVFSVPKLVFVDGGFWHGKAWSARKARLETGHNTDNWISKIERNMERDREQICELTAAGGLSYAFGNRQFLPIWTELLVASNQHCRHRFLIYLLYL
jgi:DNA mismatch endonuclease Vsr